MRTIRFVPLGLGLLVGLLLIGGGLPARTLAQAPERLASLTISVWPEYDDPRVLVQYEGELTQKDGLPRPVSFLVPSGAAINASAYISGTDFLLTDPPTTQDAGNGFMRVTVNLPKPLFHLEYYYSPLQGSPDKTMEFAYKAAQPVDNATLSVREPLKATNFTTTPAPTTQSTTAQHGFKDHVFELGALTVDQVTRIQVSYTKTDPNPSVSNVQAPAATPGAGTTADAAAQPSNLNQWLAVGLIAAGVAVAGLAVYAWWNSRRAAEVAEVAGRRRRPRKGGSTGATGASTPAATFCPNCGRGLGPNDNFCPSCGTPKRAV